MTASKGQEQSEQTRGYVTDMKSCDLFQGKKQLRIEHEGEVYTLRITSKGKLILTK